MNRQETYEELHHLLIVAFKKSLASDEVNDKMVNAAIRYLQAFEVESLPALSGTDQEEMLSNLPFRKKA